MDQNVNTQYRTVCSACLCTEQHRNLLDLNISAQANEIFQLIMNDFVGGRHTECILKTEQLVCWECLALMKRFFKFKWQVHSAQELLRLLALHGPPESTDYTQPISRLRISTKTEYDMTYYDSTTTEEELQEICTVDSHEIKEEHILEIRDNMVDYEELIANDPLTSTLQTKPEINVSIKQEPEIDPTTPNIGFNFEPQILVHSQLETTASENTVNKNNESPTSSMKDKKIPIIQRNRKTTTKVVTEKRNAREIHPILVTASNSHISKETVPTRKHGSLINVSRPVTLEKLHSEKDKEINENLSIDDKAKFMIMSRTELNKLREKKRDGAIYNSSLFKCEKCIEKFSSKELLDEHNIKHDKAQGNYSCDVCEQRFTNESIRKEHFEDHFKIYQCMKCTYQNVDILKLSNHIHRMHRVSIFECRHCNIEFKTFREKRRHCLKFHYKKRSCDECGKRFSSVAALKAHQAGPHQDEKAECPICKKQLRKLSLKAHMRTHNTTEETVYCVECGTMFKNKLTYANHLKKSTKHNTIEELGFKCVQCNKYFKTRTALNNHIEYEHIGRQYSCKMCKKEYKSKKGLLRHTRAIHEGITPPVKLRMCEVCGKSFKTKRDIVEHVNKHKGLRPHVCQDCGNTFCYSAALYTHRRLKHKVKKLSERTSEK